ncbi:MAG: hypothetical protein ACRDOO_21610 [Actinomadura sp.]
MYTGVMGWIGTVLWVYKRLPQAWQQANRFMRHVESQWRPRLEESIGRLPRSWRGIAAAIAALPLLLLGFAGVGFWYFISAAARAEGDLDRLSLVPDIYMVIYTVYLVIGVGATAATAEEGRGAGAFVAAVCSLPAWALVALVVLIELARVFLGFLFSFGQHWPQFDLPLGAVTLLSLAPPITFWVCGSALYTGVQILKRTSR